MFCPRCGSTQSEELKFCKACGANLQAVRQVVDTKDADQKFDWSKTWVAEMLMSGEEAVKRQVEMERQRGITPATRRYREIKAGIITSSVGLGIAAFLSVFMEGIIRSGKVSLAAAEILSHLWIVGIIPFLVGSALIINGWLVSKKIVELWNQSEQPRLNPAAPDTERDALRAGDTNEFVPSTLSVTEGTTKHLGSANRR